MAVKSAKNTGFTVNYLIIFIGGLVLIIAAILVFLLVLKGVYGRYEIDEITPTKANLSLLTAEKNKVAVLYSKYTENRLEDGDTWLSDNVSTWESFLSANKFAYDIISDQTIELGNHMGYKVIILPGSSSLSDRELSQLKKYINNGGSIFATGGTATVSQDAKWRGWEFFTEVFGMNFTREMDPEETYKIHTLRGNLPITAGIPTGYTLKIATWDRPIYAKVLEPRTTQVSFWFDFRKEAGLVREQIENSAGIAYGSYGKGRFVWFGFEINSVIGEQEDYIYFDRMFKNCMNWLTYQPVSYIRDWPSPYDAAAVLIPTITNEPANISNLFGVMRNYRYPAVFFVDPYIALENPSLMRETSQYGEFGGLSDVGFLESVEDTVNKLFDRPTQVEVMMKTRDIIDSTIINPPIKGFSPLYGFSDENSLQAMSLTGYNFMVLDSLTDRSVPKIEYRNEIPILILTKTARDDYKIIDDYGLRDLDFQKYTYEEDVDRILFEGGLYLFRVHTDSQLRSQYAPVVGEMMKYIVEKNFWLPTIDQLYQWWLRRGGIEIQYTTRSKRRLALEITNPGNQNTEDFVVQVYVNKKIKDIKISSDIINTEIPDFTFDESSNTILLDVENLESGESRSLLIDFENVESDNKVITSKL
ncbi:MAG: hypothetical protein K9J16_11690 [Melioribacteraceae bacterium]|nr:hypothetical protein [Melioribacteraceae bacterium]MCF8354563.1 hypothetical protein [Melioribacteraceae bacterium]MCF8394495.1 hypothetical protein [Melioribacteraceae bacterium]MCF8420095.1 hypothetical protein [Melioribacteraceae bacterium]